MLPRTLKCARRSASGLALAALIAVSSACVWRRTDPAGPPDANVITQAEIDSAHVFTAYDVIRKLRPNFLVSRGRLGLDPTVPPALPNVYVDNQYYGTAASLQTIEAGTIASIRYYDAAEAQYRFGRNNMAGVIGIFTRQ